MKHKVKVTVLDKKLYPELQQQYCDNPISGACPCYNVGDEFIFYRDEERDDFWHIGLNTLVKPVVMQIPLPEVRKCHSALKHGMLFHVIFIPDYKAVPL